MTDPQERLDAEARADDEAQTESALTPAVVPAPVEPGLADATGVDAAAPAVVPAAAAMTAESGSPPAEPVAAPVAGVPLVETRPRPERPSPATPPEPRPRSPYAIIETGGKQYRVSVGDRLSVEKLPADEGADVTIDRVLLLGGNGATRVGTPTVAGAAVTARVEDQYRGEKIVVFKYKAKKRYRRRQGHRQSLTRLTITGITG